MYSQPFEKDLPEEKGDKSMPIDEDKMRYALKRSI